MKIVDVYYNEVNDYCENDYLTIISDNNNDIRIDMDIIINEIDLQLASDENWKSSSIEFYYLIDSNFDFYLNPDDTIDIRITDLFGYAYHVILSLHRLIAKVI